MKILVLVVDFEVKLTSFMVIISESEGENK